MRLRSGPPGRVAAARRTPAMEAQLELSEAWEEGEAEVEALWRERVDATPSVLAAMVKIDLRCRFARGESPAVAEYLARHPGLGEVSPLVVSLVYEEYCLREEVGQTPDPAEFCGRYAKWGDSLASQLQYHRLLSQVAGRKAPPFSFPEPGERFLNYHLLSYLGRGGEARVYLARDLDLGDCPRALKVGPDRGDEPSIMGRLDHPRIVPVLSVARDEATGLRGLCMPFRGGRALHEVLLRMETTPLAERTARTLWAAVAPEGQPQAPPPGLAWEGFPVSGTYTDAVAWVAAALADGLSHAHRLGIQHRDIKPANVLMTMDGGPQLLDFNLAHDPHDARQADAARRGGTLPYMAPEQISAFLDAGRWDEVGRAADLYALGLVIRELLTGRRPEAPSADLPLPRALQEQLDRRREPTDGPRAVNPSVPATVEAIVRRCLHPEPWGRYTEARSLANDLRLHLDGRLPDEAGAYSRLDRAGSFVRRHWIALAATAALVFIGLPAGFVLSREAPAVTAAREGHDLLRVHAFGSAVARFEHALRLDPENQPARDGLQRAAREQAIIVLGDETTADGEEGIRRGREFNRLFARAEDCGYVLVALDAPYMGRAASYLAMSEYDAEVVAAHRLADRALVLDSTSWRVHHALGVVAMVEKRHADARDEHRAAYEAALINPPQEHDLVPAVLLAQSAGGAFASGDLDGADETLDLAWPLVVSGRIDDARKRTDARAGILGLRALVCLGRAEQAWKEQDADITSFYLDEARRLATEAASFNPDDPKATAVLKALDR